MKIHQHEIDAKIQQALEAKMRNGYSATANVCKTWISSRRFSLGFNFRVGLAVGDVFVNDDGTRCEVLALV